ncbi:MAG TPA: TonB-dependent receptor [Bryobacteraceae bacterium]|nr:TonB-dependent receptor [Bryobacteraceae bacterium]
MCKRTSRLALLALLAIFLVVPGSQAQNITSMIVGLVTDASGGGVPAAEITVTNEGTGISFKTTGDASGAYAVPNLQAGTYTVTATAAGFQTFRTTGVQVLASQSVRVNVQMQIGEIQQSVSVSGEAPLVKTESPTIGGTLTSKHFMELPLPQQSIDYLMQLVPGAQVSGSSPQTGGATHWGSFNFTINGTQANDFGNGAGAYAYGLGLISLPAPQSMQEFKVEAYNTNAEYKSLGTITMVTKAGTNGLHGDLFEYHQNKVLNANTFLNNANNRSRPASIRNQFGFNVGGPIIKNKAFFFFDYSGTRYRSYGSPQLTIPGVAMRQGDFSALCGAFDANGICIDPKGTQLYNPFTGNPFPNNRIPTSMITSQAQALNKFLPPPTQATNATGVPGGGINYYGLIPAASTVNAMDLRIDYQISDKDQLYGVYTRNIGDPLQVVQSYPSTYGHGSNFGYKTFGYSLVETHTFNPHTLNDFRFAWFDHPGIRTGMNLDFDPRTLFPQLTPSPNRGLPTMTMSGYTGMFYDYGKGYYGHGFNFEYTDNITWVRNRHTFKFGAQTTTYKSYGPNPNAPLGTFNFSGQWTGNKGWPDQPQSQGNAYADFLLGVVNSTATGSAGVFAGVYWNWDTEFYAQDTWQATNKLTVYYGVRYMYQTPWNWQNGYSTYWDPQKNVLALPQDSDTVQVPPVGANANMISAYKITTTKALGIPARYMIGDKNNWGPRVGFAYRPFSNSMTVFRAGYGVYYNFNPAFVGSRDDVLSPPWVGGLGGFTGANYTSQIPGKPTTTFLPDITFADPFPSRLQIVSGVSPNPSVYSMQRDFKNPVVQQWNATLEHQFTPNWAARITYAGSQTHHLQWMFSDFNVPNKQIPNVPIQQQRPYQPWSTIYSTRSGAVQNMNQLQLEATKRFSKGLIFQLEYAWTRSLDNAEYIYGPMNPNAPGLDYGNSTGIRRHVLVFNYVYELPFGRGRQFLSGMNKLADAVVGGWQVSGISTYQTGAPFSVGFQIPPSYASSWWSPLGVTNRADLVANTSLYNKGSGHDVVSGVPWFNTAAFAPPQPWTWGNSSRNMLFGPGSWNWDISASKSFYARERFRLQFRADFLNAFNHFNLGGPSATIADTRDGGTPILTSGKIYGGSGSRVVQAGVHLSF